MAVSLSARYGSPRSPEHPMAFTTVEFARGAGLAWLLFNLATPLAMGILSGAAEAIGAAIEGRAASGFSGIVLGYIMVSPFYLVPWSLGALLVLGAPGAWLLGRSLAGIAERRIHLGMFTALGLVVGAIAVIVFTVVQPDPPPMRALPWIDPLLAVTTGAAVAVGWRSTAYRALRADARRTGP